MIKPSSTVYTIQWRSGSVTALGAFREIPPQFKALSWLYEDRIKDAPLYAQMMVKRLVRERTSRVYSPR
jgi:hypothetical protein